MAIYIYCDETVLAYTAAQGHPADAVGRRVKRIVIARLTPRSLFGLDDEDQAFHGSDVDLAPDSPTLTLLVVTFSGPELGIQSYLPANPPQTDGRGEAVDHSRDLTATRSKKRPLWSAGGKWMSLGRSSAAGYRSGRMMRGSCRSPAELIQVYCVSPGDDSGRRNRGALRQPAENRAL